MDGNKKVVVVTHNAGFHTDDVFAVATLSLYFKKHDIDFSVIRSRDSEVIASGDYVVDVGGIYDSENNKFDHHQEGKAGERENGIPYASFGLVWKKFGKELCGSADVALKVDEKLAVPIDALDNGIQLVKAEKKGIMPVDMWFLIYMFYPTWKEEDMDVDSVFMDLVEYAAFILKRYIKVAQDNVEAEKFVLEAYNASKDKRLIDVGSNHYPWNEVLIRFSEPVFVIYKNIKNDTWSIKSIRNDLLSFENRKTLPKEWAGKTDAEFEKITGIPGVVFCHNNLFMAVAKSKEAILKLAEIALNS
jgi:uncharacterized UPF0160 family protein